MWSGGSAGAGQRRGRSVVSAWRASNRGVRLVSLSERLARGIGPRSSRSICGISGSRGQRAGQAAEQVEAGLLVDVGLGLADDASPSRSAVKASRRRRSRRTVASASSGVSPGDEPVRHVRRPPTGPAAPGPRPPSEPAGASASASRSHQGTRSPASPRYSARCRRTDSGVVSTGMASMNRKSWTLTWGRPGSGPSAGRPTRPAPRARARGRSGRTARGRSRRPSPRFESSRSRSRHELQ